MSVRKNSMSHTDITREEMEVFVSRSIRELLLRVTKL